MVGAASLISGYQPEVGSLFPACRVVWPNKNVASPYDAHRLVGLQRWIDLDAPYGPGTNGLFAYDHSTEDDLGLHANMCYLAALSSWS